MRHAGWQAMLDNRVSAYEQTPFDWRDHNCTNFAANWVREASNAPLTVPATLDAREALRAINGLGGLLAEASKQLGKPLLGTFAQHGDLVLLRLPRSRDRVSYAFGICLGSVCAAPGALGLVMVPITEAEAAWRV